MESIIFGKNEFLELPIESKSNRIKKPSKILIKEKILCIAGSRNDFLYYLMNGDLILRGEATHKMEKTLNISFQIKSLKSNYSNFLLLSFSGDVFVIGNGVSHSLYFKKVGEHIYQANFQGTKLEGKTISKIEVGRNSFYYLTTEGELYGSGRNNHGELNGNKLEQNKPILVHQNVLSVSGGTMANSIYFQTFDNKFYCQGGNLNGKLGISTKQNSIQKTELTFFKNFNSLKLYNGHEHSIALCDGEIYGCGSADWCGLGHQSSVFTKIKVVDGPVVKVRVGAYHTVFVTEGGDLYGFGGDFWNQLGLDQEKCVSIRHPRKIQTGFKINIDEYKISTSILATAVYPRCFNTCYSGFSDLFSNHRNELTGALDSIKGIPVHKSLVECRAKMPLETIKEKLKNHDQQEILSWLEWVYTEKINGFKAVDSIMYALHTTHDWKHQRLQNDISKLWDDQNSSDFTIIVPDPEIEKEVDEQEDDDDEEFDEIYVHKFLLFAKSGLFQKMFTNVEEKLNSVKDYSKKTFESLELIFKFFYTNSIELSADHDPELVVEELADTEEYYQLMETGRLARKLETIKKRYL
ncbi:regulator of chromosome condensation [Anaeramoeba flamelloides]|uniref:Regulator of chromosome condensation n=1 Tax=Anaeramoeba flamelloides TaxID=1746091 RepID=A0AAV7ZHM5_9EUKA|nr:regulator of chromosome condensation [Anaeramoeba flamelloides]